MKTSHGKKRFSLQIPGLGTLRYGTCEEQDDDWRDIICEQGEYYLVHFTPHYERELGRFHLSPLSVVSHGYYDSEHSGFVVVKDFNWD